MNGKQVSAEVSGDTILLDVLRDLGCYSVKCGCETTNCGLCTVWINGRSRLSCSILAAGIEGQEVTTLEGLKEEAEEFGAFLAQEGAEQCGFCSPGFIMNVLAMVRELENPNSGRDERISRRKFVQMYRIYGTASGDREIYGRKKADGERKGGSGMGNRVVSQAIPKVDYKALVTGKAVYTDDLAAKDSLIVKVLRSPHAHALIQDINLTRAELVPDIECILTYKDCPDKRFTMAGQTYPEPSPYDSTILDQRVRFVGDAVAIVAGRTKEAVNKALKLIKVKYEVLEPVLDFHKAKNRIQFGAIREENWKKPVSGRGR